MLLPKQAQDLINDPLALKALATISSEGVLNLIPVGSMNAPDLDTIVLAAMSMKEAHEKEAHENLKKAMETGKLVSVIAAKTMPEKGAFSGFQLRCKVMDFDNSILGPFYLGMRTTVKNMGFETSEIQGAWVLEPVEVINQSPGPEARKKIT